MKGFLCKYGLASRLHQESSLTKKAQESRLETDRCKSTSCVVILGRDPLVPLSLAKLVASQVTAGLLFQAVRRFSLPLKSLCPSHSS